MWSWRKRRTAPRPALQGKNVANPLAMILAGSSLLDAIGTAAGRAAARAIHEAVFEAVYEGLATADLGGHSSTSEFTDETIRRVRAKLQVWADMV